MFAAARIEDWNKAMAFADALTGWVFRGHGDTSWQLSTRIERDASAMYRAGFTLAERERWVLREFQRRAHHYLSLIRFLCGLA